MSHLLPVFCLAQDHHTEIAGVRRRVTPQERPVWIINDEGYLGGDDGIFFLISFSYSMLTAFYSLALLAGERDGQRVDHCSAHGHCGSFREG